MVTETVPAGSLKSTGYYTRYTKCSCIKAKILFDKCEYKQAKVHLSRATDVCKEMLQLKWFKTPLVRSMPELQTEYLLALLFRTKGTYCFNIHMFKTSPAVAKMAYKFVGVIECNVEERIFKEVREQIKGTLPPCCCFYFRRLQRDYLTQHSRSCPP